MDIAEITQLRKNGSEALRRGDARAARDSFQRLADAGQADVNIWIALAGASGRLGDLPAAQAAADRALLLEPRNLRALIVKADLLAHQGDVRAAAPFYLAATQAAPPVNQLTADLRADLQRAQTILQQYGRQFEAVLMGEVTRAGFDPSTSSARFRQSLDLLFGRKRTYFQNPRYYNFPELPQIQFFDRKPFAWLDRVEAATADIRDELLAVLEDSAAFKPYVEQDPRAPRNPDNRMAGNPEWSAFYLWKNGAAIEENIARCPKTMAALSDVPLPDIPKRSPSILFSLMKPGAHIPPHNGFVNTRVICHLPVIVPAGCYFRVGNEEREWVEGKAWAFDDTIEHEAWNRSRQTRVVLLFEAWRPELTEEERGLVRAMFRAIDAHGGDFSEWGI
jgi:aspartyl/asparaginyl beta-hydroxylase (cupin superfamily)